MSHLNAQASSRHFKGVSGGRADVSGGRADVSGSIGPAACR